MNMIVYLVSNNEGTFVIGVAEVENVPSERKSQQFSFIPSTNRSITSFDFIIPTKYLANVI